MIFDILYVQIITYMEAQNRAINYGNRVIGILYNVGQGVPGSVNLVLDKILPNHATEECSLISYTLKY